MKQTANANFQEQELIRKRWLQTALKTLETANLTADQRMQLELDIAYHVSYEESLLAKGEARGVAKARKEGVAKGIEKSVVAMFKSGKHTAEEIAYLMDMPVAQVQSIKAKHKL